LPTVVLRHVVVVIVIIIIVIIIIIIQLTICFAVCSVDITMSRRSFEEEMLNLFGLLLRQNLEREDVAPVYCFNLDDGNHGSHRRNERLYEPKFCQRTRLLS